MGKKTQNQEMLESKRLEYEETIKNILDALRDKSVKEALKLLDLTKDHINSKSSERFYSIPMRELGIEVKLKRR